MVLTDGDLFIPDHSSKQGGLSRLPCDIQGHALAALFLVFIAHL